MPVEAVYLAVDVGVLAGGGVQLLPVQPGVRQPVKDLAATPRPGGQLANWIKDTRQLQMGLNETQNGENSKDYLQSTTFLHT